MYLLFRHTMIKTMLSVTHLCLIVGYVTVLTLNAHVEPQQSDLLLQTLASTLLNYAIPELLIKI